jgi:RNA polymerase sigma factor (sigma-70 family)
VYQAMGAEAQAGDGAVAEQHTDLESFCRREHRRLVGAVGLYLNDVSLAEEIAQEALLRVCRAWPRVQQLESPGGWAHRVAMNLAVSAARSRRTRQRVDERLSTYARRLAEDADAAGALAMRVALAKLPERQREALVLRYYGDLSVAETAVAMSCPEGTVKTLTSRAVAALRRMGWEVEE